MDNPLSMFSRGIYYFHGIIRYSFPCKDNLEPLDSFKDEFLHLGGLLGEGFDLGSASKKRVDCG